MERTVLTDGEHKVSKEETQTSDTQVSREGTVIAGGGGDVE